MSNSRDLANRSTDFVSVKDFGAVGDGVTDDTAAIQAALNYCYTNNLTLMVPAGTYKTTAPLTLTYYTGANTKASVNIIGTGGTTMGITTREPASKIVAYNIPSLRCALEIWGENNGNMMSSKIENLLIECDYDTCNSLSFCLGVGDSWFFYLNRIKLYGFNNLLIRNGSKVGATSYGTMTSRCQQVMFETHRYYDFAGSPTGTKAIYGWAVCPERMFVDNTAMFAYASDALTFSNCQFYGSVLSFISSAVYENCMWAIPGSARPAVATSGVAAINRNFYDVGDASSTLDGSIGLYLMAGNVHLINPYFEDVPRGIYARGQGSNQIISTLVDNITFISQANQPGAGSAPFQAEFALKSHTSAGSMARLEMRGGRYSVGNAAPFVQNFLVNGGWRNLIVDGVYNLTRALITDTMSLIRKVQYDRISNQDTTATFTGAVTLAASNAAYITGQNTWIADKDYYVDTITVTLGGLVNITTGSHAFILYDYTVPASPVALIKFYIDSPTTPTPRENANLKKTIGSASGVYVLNNLSTTTDIESSIANRRFVVVKDTPLRCVLSKVDSAGTQDDGESVVFSVLLKAV